MPQPVRRPPQPNDRARLLSMFDVGSARDISDLMLGLFDTYGPLSPLWRTMHEGYENAQPMVHALYDRCQREANGHFDALEEHDDRVCRSLPWSERAAVWHRVGLDLAEQKADVGTVLHRAIHEGKYTQARRWVFAGVPVDDEIAQGPKAGERPIDALLSGSSALRGPALNLLDGLIDHGASLGAVPLQAGRTRRPSPMVRVASKAWFGNEELNRWVEDRLLTPAFLSAWTDQASPQDGSALDLLRGRIDVEANEQVRAWLGRLDALIAQKEQAELDASVGSAQASTVGPRAQVRL